VQLDLVPQLQVHERGQPPSSRAQPDSGGFRELWGYLLTGGVGDVTDLRLRWVGHALRADAAITVAGHLSLVEAHHIAHDTEQTLIDAVPRLTPSHVNPGPPAPLVTQSRAVH